MKISSVWYSIRQGAKNIRRNLTFSLASIGTIVACLFLLGIFYALVVNFDRAVNDIQQSVTISVFFDEGLDGEAISAIGEQIRIREEVGTMDYISGEEAWNKFVAEKFADAQEEVASAFGDDNPLADSASYEITLKDVSKQSEFVEYLQSLEGVRKVDSSEIAAKGVTTVNSIAGYASAGIIFILLLVSMFLISNTITIGITVRKDEIAIMKLIGATNMFVRAPFIVEGVIIGFIGSIIPAVVLYFMYGAVVEYVSDRFPIIETFVTFVSTKDIFSTLFPIIIGIGVGIGLIGSILTTRKHLKV